MIDRQRASRHEKKSLLLIACIGFAIYCLSSRPLDASLLAGSGFVLAICIIDTWTSRIPNIINASLTLCGLALNFSATGTRGLALSTAGIVVGIVLLIIPYLMGGFGAGDVKALAALGSLVGPWPILQIFVYMALYGGVLAALHYVSNRNLREQGVRWWQSLRAVALTRDPQLLEASKTEALRFPYAAAIALGYFTWLLQGDLL